MAGSCVQFSLKGTSTGYMELDEEWKLQEARKEAQFVWVHLNASKSGVKKWLRENLELEATTIRALLEDRVQARYARIAGGSLLIVRGPGSPNEMDAKDLHSVRMWLFDNVLVSITYRNSLAIQETLSELRSKGSAESASTIALHIVRESLRPILNFVQRLIQDVDEAEDQLFAPGENPPDEQLIEISRQAIYLRRHLTPLRGAINDLLHYPPIHSKEEESVRWQEKEQQLRVMTEDIDLIRDRVGIIRTHIEAHQSKELNHRLYIFSVLAVLFLPLSFITGLFGINVGGIIWADEPYGFIYFSSLLSIFTLTLIALLRWRRWI